MDPKVKVDVDVHVVINFPPADAGSSGEILTALRHLKDDMATLQETIATLTADDTELSADVSALVGIINDIPARIQAAVVDALTKAGVDDTTITAALNGVDATVKSAIAAAKAVLPASTGTGGQDTTGGSDTSTDTTSGGGGTDTIVGAGGDDTVTGGNGSDTVAAGGGTDTTVAGTGSDTVAGTDDGTGPAVPPPSSGGSVPPASDAA